MSHILIIGAHGRIALLAAPLLTARGDEVTGVIRNPDHAVDVSATGATPVVADIERLDTAALADLLRGHDAIVWSAGAGGGDPARTAAVDRDAAIRSIDAARDAGVRRYVMVSYLGSGLDHGLSPEDSFYPYAEAKAAADAHLRASTLDWTILAPGPLTFDEPTGLIEVARPGRGQVSRADVASVIAATLAEPRTVHRRIAFGAGSTPIAEAIAG